jgi:hypothetical protein
VLLPRFGYASWVLLLPRYFDGFGFSFRPGHVEFDRIEDRGGGV